MLESRMSKAKYMSGAGTSIVVALVALIIGLWNRIFPSTNIPYYSDLLANATYGSIVSLIFVTIAILLLIYFIIKYLRWASTVYAMTDQRVITKRGILGRTYEDMSLTQVTDIHVTQSLAQRFLGYGTVTFSSQSGSADDIIWQYVPDPVRMRRMAQEAMDKREMSRR